MIFGKKLFIAILLLCASITFSQVKNVKSMQGNWSGQWVNTYYGSTGNIGVVFTVYTSTKKVYAGWNVGGNILGTARDPFTTEGVFDDNGFSVNFTSSIWGDITGTGLFSGSYSGTAVNCPNPNAQDITAAGTFDNLKAEGTFTFNWYGTLINGTFNITKDNPIKTPTSVSGSESTPLTVTVSWSDQSNNETGFRIERKVQSTDTWTALGTVQNNATSYDDNTVEPQTTYNYRVIAYNSETESEYSDEASVTTAATDVKGNGEIVSNYLLTQNYPNPFNPSTVIQFQVPRESRINIDVHDLRGKKIISLTQGTKSPGIYEVTFDGSNLASGIYFVKMTAESIQTNMKFSDTKKIVLLK